MVSPNTSPSSIIQAAFHFNMKSPPLSLQQEKSVSLSHTIKEVLQLLSMSSHNPCAGISHTAPPTGSMRVVKVHFFHASRRRR